MADKNQPIWVLVNCNSQQEAQKIGDLILSRRLASCFDIFPRALTKYFWPAKSGKIEQAKGALLVIETFEKNYKDVQALVKKNHSDKLPFIGFISIEGVSDNYRNWMHGEIK